MIIFSQEIKTAEASGRIWPTVRIFRKIDNSKPEILAEVGKIGEPPASFALNPDKKFLLINLEKKLQILDLESKEIRGLFVPKRKIRDIVYSPDGKQIFIWDQEMYDSLFYLHLFTINTGKDEIIKEGSSGASYYYPIKWRDDGKIILEKAIGEFSELYYLDLLTKQIIKTDHTSSPFTVFRRTGRAMNAEKSWISDICNRFSGDAPNSYEIIEPVSNKIFETIGIKDEAVDVLAFSPDNKEILVSTYKPWTKEEDCQKEPIRNHYKDEISSGRLIKIDNPLEVLAKWKIDYVDAKVNTEPPNWNFILRVGGKPIMKVIPGYM